MPVSVAATGHVGRSHGISGLDGTRFASVPKTAKTTRWSVRGSCSRTAAATISGASRRPLHELAVRAHALSHPRAAESPRAPAAAPRRSRPRRRRGSALRDRLALALLAARAPERTRDAGARPPVVVRAV